MTSPATVGGDDRLRLFLALRVPEPVLDAIEEWQLARLRGVRIVPREHLHVTLAFLGHRPAAELEPTLAELRRAAAGAAGLRLAAARYRETRSVGMIALDDEGGRATALADDLQAGLELLGVYRRGARAWLPHLTVARFRERPRLLLDPPALGTFVPSDAAAYLSRLRPSGAQYEVLESVPLGAQLGGR
ncbi:MAG: 2,3-cyclic 3-phosphodiesterase [Actinomycetota bacterium]|jgi:2'-5' RNA ligase